MTSTHIVGTLNGQPMTGIVFDEYLRRNLLHASAVGAEASLRVSLNRIRKWKSPPKWLVEILAAGLERAVPVSAEMAAHRNEVHTHEPGEEKEPKA